MEKEPMHYFILYKPYNMVSQFLSSHQVPLLGDLGYKFPQGIHAVGRLDKDSEGLLILTTNKNLTKLLFLSDNAHKRTYLVQVEKQVSRESLDQLRKGVSIQIKGNKQYMAIPSEASITENPDEFAIISRVIIAYYPYTWLLITLTEGKFHQVRKMVSAINHRCIRLIRVSIEGIKLGSLSPGEVMEMDEREFFQKLCIPKES
jgi:23S rRNA pseudouridine2457 synthase